MSSIRPANSPNVIFAFADQWRAQATGYAGDPNVRTPHMDALAARSINFTNAISGCSVCCPYRAGFLTGQQPLTHGVFVNDVCLNPEAESIGKVFRRGGYDTAYVGKWHVDGHGRESYIPPERRQGFDYWKALECTHNYNKSPYFENASTRKKYWDGYDAIAQTRDLVEYLEHHDRRKPFLAVLSWGPPHAPYAGAPEEFAGLYDPKTLALPANCPETVPAERVERDSRHYVRPDRKYDPREWLAGYYANCSAVDACVGMLTDAIDRLGLDTNTILVVTSDHGDMLGSHGEVKKQRPWEESIAVPFLLRAPGIEGWSARTSDAVIDAPDIMPTLLGLCGLEVPGSVEGVDFSSHVRGGEDPTDGAAVLSCPHPFGQYCRNEGGREYRGLRAKRYTYVRDLNGPWLLYDNEVDPNQMRNLVDEGGHVSLVRELDALLQRKLDALGDDFLPGMEYVRRWGYPVDENETVPYTK